MKKKINLIVDERDKNLRVDVFIANKEKSISRTRIKNLILGKQLRLNDKILIDPSKKINFGDNIDLQLTAETTFIRDPSDNLV